MTKGSAFGAWEKVLSHPTAPQLASCELRPIKRPFKGHFGIGLH